MSNEIVKYNNFINDLKKNNPELSFSDMIYYANIALYFHKNDPGTSDSIYYEDKSKKYYQGDVNESIENIRVVYDCCIYFDATFKCYDDNATYKALFMLEPSFEYNFKHVDKDGNCHRIYNLCDVEYQFDCHDDITKINKWNIFK